MMLTSVENFNLFNWCIVTRNTQSGNTGRLNRNLYVMLKIAEWPKTPGMTSNKTVLFLKGISSFAGDFEQI